MRQKKNLLKNEEKDEEKVERKKEIEKLKEKENNNIIDKETSIILGSFEQAPKFLQSNEYIKNGYIINCKSFKTAFKCIFKLHNETINTWSHLLGTIFFVFLIFYTIFYITNFKIQLNIIREDKLSLVEEKAVIVYELSPATMHNYYNKVKNIQKSFNNYKQKIIYNETINSIFILYNDVFNYINSKFTSFIEYVQSFLKSLSILKDEVVDLINLDETKTDKLKSYLNSEVIMKMEERQKKELSKFPLYIMIISAFLCLSFSTSYHALKIVSPIVYNISHRFDHGGISILISGSCFPPYYYFFYFENKFKYFYLIEITAIGLIIFFYSILNSDFSQPYKRTFRGILFIIFGICTGIPVLHMGFFGESIKGYYPGIKLKYWYLGAFSYLFGAILYILRFPERKFLGKFDYFGSSHQIFHVLVFLGATSHFLGSLDAYIYRFNNLEI